MRPAAFAARGAGAACGSQMGARMCFWFCIFSIIIIIIISIITTTIIIIIIMFLWLSLSLLSLSLPLSLLSLWLFDLCVFCWFTLYFDLCLFGLFAIIDWWLLLLFAQMCFKSFLLGATARVPLDVGNVASRDFDICPRNLCVEVLWSIAESCGDGESARKQRRETTKSWLARFPVWTCGSRKEYNGTLDAFEDRERLRCAAVPVLQPSTLAKLKHVWCQSFGCLYHTDRMYIDNKSLCLQCNRSVCLYYW